MNYIAKVALKLTVIFLVSHVLGLRQAPPHLALMPLLKKTPVHLLPLSSPYLKTQPEEKPSLATKLVAF